MTNIPSRERFFERLAQAATHWSGSTLATILAFLVVLVWTAGGFYFSFNTDYQMYINTGTTIVTFLMVFLIQRAQNKDSLAVHLKLNELVAALEGASNRLINVENLSEGEVRILARYFCELSELARKDESISQARSIEEACHRHTRKKRRRKLTEETEGT